MREDIIEKNSLSSHRKTARISGRTKLFDEARPKYRACEEFCSAPAIAIDVSCCFYMRIEFLRKTSDAYVLSQLTFCLSDVHTALFKLGG